MPPPESEQNQVAVAESSDEEAEIVPFSNDVASVSNLGAGGSASQVRPFDPPRLQKWILSVHDDPETKTVKLKYRLTRLKFKIHDSDLREQFVKGFGPGGQKTNKSNNCVVLTHLPTMETVKCHDSRDQAVNRGIARKLLYERLDLFVNPDSSTVAVRILKKQRAKSKAAQRRKKRDEEGLSDQADNSLLE